MVQGDYLSGLEQLRVMVGDLSNDLYFCTAIKPELAAIDTWVKSLVDPEVIAKKVISSWDSHKSDILSDM